MPERIPDWFKSLFTRELLEFLYTCEITDEAKFCEAYMNTHDREVMREAVRRLRDQDRLYYYAVNSPDRGVRIAAVSCLTDDNRKLSIAENAEENIEVRMEAASCIVDEDILRRLAFGHPDRWIRRSAIIHLTDDRDLMKVIFSENEENELRYMASRVIQDQECLRKIFCSAEELSRMDHHNAIRDSIDIRSFALRRLDDHELHRSVAADYSEITAIRISAVSRLGADDQDILEMIAAKPFDPDPRLNCDLYYEPEMKASAVARLTDEQLLRQYLGDGEAETRLAAMKALGDQTVLWNAVKDPHNSIRFRAEALKHITDDEFLYEVAMYETKRVPFGPNLPVIAAKRIQDPARLADVAMKSVTYYASAAAVRCLHDDVQLLRVISGIEKSKLKWAANDNGICDHLLEQEIMKAAAQNLSDRRLLIRLALDAPCDEYEYDSLKDHCIYLLSDEPELLTEYVRQETDQTALSFAAIYSSDEGVLQAIADNEHSDSYADIKLAYYRRVGEIGMRKITELKGAE